eukprot:7386531-Prymnesium_polylepis.1
MGLTTPVVLIVDVLCSCAACFVRTDRRPPGPQPLLRRLCRLPAARQVWCSARDGAQQGRRAGGEHRRRALRL